MRHRATVWPEVRLECEAGPDRWTAVESTDDLFASAAIGLGEQAWGRFLEFVPAVERRFLETFRYGRLEALYVIARCPTLLGDLAETPALTLFLAAHQRLRGAAEPGWSEIAAVHGRDGIFGVLPWLGLPASRQTLVILRHVMDPDVPRRLLEPLRRALWEPEAIWALAHAETINDEQLARFCHALAA